MAAQMSVLASVGQAIGLHQVRAGRRERQSASP